MRERCYDADSCWHGGGTITAESVPSGDPTLAPVESDRSFASGRYRVLRILGEGAQKTVYLARDTALERECALAVLRSDAMSPDGLARVRREAQAMARLGGHPNVVGVHDIGEEGDGRPFIVCEFVDGGDLRRVLRDAAEALPQERALDVVSDVLKALAVAHASGVVHRDIKPANIWLTKSGVAKLGDFGLAAALDHTQITLAGSVMGTATYMPPEQALGGDVDGRSDLYALGAVFYELVTGRPPFLGDDALAVISQHINVAPVAPSWHNAAVSGPIEELILRLLAKLPEDRPADAEQVLEELARIRALPAAESTTSAASGAALEAVAWGRFVGRQEELEQLKAAFDQVRSGQGSLVMIAGEPGIGKTRLSEELGVYARLRGALLMHGRCYEGEAGQPYQPFIEAFRQFVRNRAEPLLREELGDGAPEIATLVSEVRRRFPDVPEAQPLDGEAQRLRLFESITQFVLRAAGSAPLVLMLDDLQWADKASLLLLRHMLPQIADERVLIVGVYRDVELDRKHPLADAIGSLRREKNYQRVLVRGLPEDSVEELLASMSESDDDSANRRALAVALYRESEGNPFFIREILSHLIEERKLYRKDGRWTSDGAGVTSLGIPEGIREVIGRRLSRLSEECNKVLVVASAMNGGFSWDAVRAVTDEDEDTLLDLFDEAVSAQLIFERKRDQSGVYDFTHALMRQTLYEEMSGPRRIALHRRIADALERLYAANLDAHVVELAYHFYEAAPRGDVDKAIEYAVRAGDAAMAMTAYDEAVSHFQHALQTLELKPVVDPAQRCDLQLRLGDAQNRAGEPKLALETLEAAAALARDLRTPDLVTRAALTMITIWTGVGQIYDPQLGIVSEALALLPQEDSVTRVRLTSALARAHAFTDAHERGVELTGVAVEMARRVGDRSALAHALDNRHFLIAAPEYAAERLLLATEQLALAGQLGDQLMVTQGHLWRLTDLFETADMAAFDAAYTVAKALLEASNLPLHQWFHDLTLVMLATVEGRFAEAELLLAQTLVSGQRVEGSQGIQLYGIQMFVLRWHQGRLSEMSILFEGLRSQLDSFPILRGILAFLQLEMGQLDDARATFEILAAGDFTSVLRDSVWLVAMSLLGQTCAVLGDRERALTLYDLLIPYEQRNVIGGEAVVSIGAASRYLGLLATTLEDWDSAERHFEHALEMNTRLRARPWFGHTQCDYATMLLRRAAPGDASKAVELLIAATAIADELGMSGLTARIADVRGGQL